jgi:hypothetical protein
MSLLAAVKIVVIRNNLVISDRIFSTVHHGFFKSITYIFLRSNTSVYGNNDSCLLVN